MNASRKLSDRWTADRDQLLNKSTCQSDFHLRITTSHSYSDKIYSEGLIACRMASSPTSTSSDDQTSSHSPPRSPSRHSYKGMDTTEYKRLIQLQSDRSKCSVCQTPVNQCLKKARAFGRDWTTFIVLHGCINPECSASG